MRRWAEFVLRHRRWIIGGWLLVMVIGAAAAGSVSNRLTVDFSLPGQPGTQAAAKIKSAFGNGGDTSPYVVTVTMPPGSTITGNEAAVARTFTAVATANPALRVIDEANTGDKAFRTPKDDRTAYALAFYRFNPSPTATLPTTAIRTAAEGAKPAGATIGVTGEDALAVGNDSGGGPGVLGETLLGGLGALLVLIFVFGSFLALLPLLVAAASILATFILLWPITYATDVSFIVQFLIALVGLGVAIDYSLLVVTRWREERDHGRDNHEAVIVAMQTAGHAVVFSGVTVAIGLLALIVLPVPFMRSMGYGGALIPLASVLTTLSLTPAILGGIGPRIDWPKVRHENRASKAWSRWAAMIVRRRWVAAITALAALGVLVGVLFGVKIGQASSGSLASNGPAYDALQRLKDGGVSTGVLTPIEVIVKAEDARGTATALAKVDGVAHALVPSGAAGTRDGVSVVVLLPDHETVNSKSVAVVDRVKSTASGLPGVIGAAGLGAAQIDFLHAVYGNFPLMLAIIAVLTYLLLVRAFRSLLLPLKAVILNLISLGATLGLMVLFWQDGHGSNAVFGIQATGAVTFWIPLMVFAFLFGLSMDYEVFILSRIRE
ncbi:MAG: MMPL family transporter, partial [Jatrophihabitantaceae bacterium]